MAKPPIPVSTPLAESVCDQRFGWLKFFNLQKSRKIASWKPQYLEDEKRWKKTFDILERHLERLIFWHLFYLLAPSNVNIESFGQSELRWSLTFSNSSFTETSISPRWKTIEEDFWYPQKALGEFDLLAACSSPDAARGLICVCVGV